MRGLIVAVVLAVLAIVSSACSSSGDEEAWTLEWGDGVAAERVAGAEVSGSFGDVFIDQFLGPETWDVADGRPPSYTAWLASSDLVAFGRLVEGDGGASLRIDDLVKGDPAGLSVLETLPPPPALPVDVVIIAGPAAGGGANLLAEPYEADRSQVVHVLLGGSESSSADRPLADIVAEADVVFDGQTTGAVDGTRVEVEVGEVFKGEGLAGGDTAWVDVGPSRIERFERSVSGVWFTVPDGDLLRSVSDTYPAAGEVTITDYLRHRLSGD